MLPVDPLSQTPPDVMTMTGVPQQPAVMPNPAPVHPVPNNPFAQQMLQAIAARRAAMEQWQAARPDMGPGVDRSLMQDWRTARPTGFGPQGSAPMQPAHEKRAPQNGPGSLLSLSGLSGRTPVGQMDWSRFANLGRNRNAG